jgi:hypothetical protein
LWSGDEEKQKMGNAFSEDEEADAFSASGSFFVVDMHAPRCLHTCEEKIKDFLNNIYCFPHNTKKHVRFQTRSDVCV